MERPFSARGPSSPLDGGRRSRDFGEREAGLTGSATAIACWMSDLAAQRITSVASSAPSRHVASDDQRLGAVHKGQHVTEKT